MIFSVFFYINGHLNPAKFFPLQVPMYLPFLKCMFSNCCSLHNELKSLQYFPLGPIKLYPTPQPNKLIILHTEKHRDQNDYRSNTANNCTTSSETSTCCQWFHHNKQARLSEEVNSDEIPCSMNFSAILKSVCLCDLGAP